MQMIIEVIRWGVLWAVAMATLLSCGSQPAYEVTSAPVARTGTVESVREVVQNKDPSGAGMIIGGLVGGGLGSLVGGGTGRTVATVVGAVGGGYIGNQVEKSQTQVVYQISVRYDDGTWATIQQNSPMGLHVGDRVVVSDRGVELLQP